MSNLHSTTKSENDSESEGEDDDDDDEDEEKKPQMTFAFIKHQGCVNRIRVSYLFYILKSNTYSDIPSHPRFIHFK